MKRIIPLFLVLSLLLGGCCFVTNEKKPVEVPDVTEELITEPTTESTEPVTEAPTEAPRIFGVITNDVLNVRPVPGGDGEPLAVLEKGQRLEILDMAFYDVYLWGKIDQGWVSLSYVSLDDPDVVLLSQEEDQKGVTMVDKLTIYQGPNAQYPTNGSYAKGTRLEISGVCGKWARTKDGWVNVYDVYIDGTKGPENSVICKVDYPDVNLMADPDGSAQVVRRCVKDEQLDILYQAKVDGNLWGCTKEGWIPMNYVTVCMDRAIVGNWYAYTADLESGQFLIDTYKFRADGSYQYICYLYWPSLPIENMEGVGFTGDEYGTFTYDGKKLVRKYMYSGPYMQEEVSYSTEATIKGDVMTLKVGISTVTLHRGKPADAAKMVIKENYDTEIVGAWVSTRYLPDGENVKLVERTFNKDGTFVRKEYSYNLIEDIYRTVSTTNGTYYYYDGMLQECDEGFNYWNAYELTINNKEMTLDEVWDTFHYNKSDIKATMKELRKTLKPASVQDAALTTTWTAVSVNTYSQHIRFNEELKLNSDGTFEETIYSRAGYYYTSGGLVHDGSYGSEAVVRKGVYSYSGGKLTLTYMFDTSKEFAEAFTKTLSVSISGSTMIAGENTYRTGTWEEIAARVFAE